MDKNRRGLCYVMDQEDLTTMRILYDFRTGEVYLSASKDWDDDLDWSAYNKSFYAESIKTHNAKYLNEQEVYEIFDKHGLTDYLNDVISLLRQGRHFGILALRNRKLDIFYMGNQHSRCNVRLGRGMQAEARRHRACLQGNKRCTPKAHQGEPERSKGAWTHPYYQCIQTL